MAPNKPKIGVLKVLGRDKMGRGRERCIVYFRPIERKPVLDFTGKKIVYCVKEWVGGGMQLEAHLQFRKNCKIPWDAHEAGRWKWN